MNYPLLLACFMAYAVICIQGELFDLGAFGKVHDLLLSRHTQVDTTILKTNPSRVRSVSRFKRG